MRDAALMIATLGDDYAPSLAARFGRWIAGRFATVRRHLAAGRALHHVGHLDERLLADIGLAPADLDGLDPMLPAATRRLAAAAADRRRVRVAEERWRRA